MIPEPGTVHLYRASLISPPVPPAELAALLDEGERARVGRFHFDHLRRRQRVATGLLRWVLGGVTGTDPRALRFEMGEHGKPALAGGPVFNLSHSEDWWLLGVAGDGRLGVDVEVHRALPDLDSLAHSTFHPDEAAEVVGQPDREARHAAFFRVWSRKESFIKAVGMGLSYRLDGFQVHGHPGADHALRAIDDPAERPGAWTLRSVSWAPELAAAIAWDRPEARLLWCTVDERAP